MSQDYPAAPSSSDEGSTTRTAKHEASDVAHDAARRGRNLAHDARSEAEGVGREAGRQAKDLLGQGREELVAQASEQQHRVAEGLHSLGGELSAMADAAEEPGLASDLVHQAATRADAAARWLDDREPGALLDEVKQFARRRPGTFLAVAAVAGLAVGRLTRGITDDGGSSGRTADDDARSGTAGEGAQDAESPASIGNAPARPSAFGAVGAAAAGSTADTASAGGPAGGGAPTTGADAESPLYGTGPAYGATQETSRPPAGTEGAFGNPDPYATEEPHGTTGYTSTGYGTTAGETTGYGAGAPTGDADRPHAEGADAEGSGNADSAGQPEEGWR